MMTYNPCVIALQLITVGNVNSHKYVELYKCQNRFREKSIIYKRNYNRIYSTLQGKASCQHRFRVCSRLDSPSLVLLVFLESTKHSKQCCVLG